MYNSITKMDWYYKRYKLVSIITATELFMLTDKSQGFSETYGFLQRALDDVEKGEDVLSQVSDTLFGLWKAKNSAIEMLKSPVIDKETLEAKRDYDNRFKPTNL